MAVLGPGGDRPAPRAAAAQRRTARRGFLASRGMPRSSRGPHVACCVGWRRQGKKVAAAPLRAGDRGAARTFWPTPPIERPDGQPPSRKKTVASPRSDDQGVMMAPWREASRRHRAWPALARGGGARSARRRQRQIGKAQPDRGRTALNGGFRGAHPAELWSSAAAKRVCDPQPVLDGESVVHILRPERVALGAGRGGGDHRVVD